jgi:hypothetical protein
MFTEIKSIEIYNPNIGIQKKFNLFDKKIQRYQLEKASLLEACMWPILGK